MTGTRLPAGKFDGVETVPMFDVEGCGIAAPPTFTPRPFGSGVPAAFVVQCPFGTHPVHVIDDNGHLRYAVHMFHPGAGSPRWCDASEADTARLPVPWSTGDPRHRRARTDAVCTHPDRRDEAAG